MFVVFDFMFWSNVLFVMNRYCFVDIIVNIDDNYVVFDWLIYNNIYIDERFIYWYLLNVNNFVKFKYEVIMWKRYVMWKSVDVFIFKIFWIVSELF